MTFVVHRRDGLYSLEKTATRLCGFIVTFAPIIERLYPENEALQTALAAALAACQALATQIAAQKTPGV
jgi:hypothetical protein